MTSRIVVNNIEADAGVSTVTFGSNISGTFVGSISVSGVTTVAAGSTSAPSITPTGDSNTGIFFPSADTIAFAEGGVEALRINSSSNIGIGTTNPTTRLDVFVNGGEGIPSVVTGERMRIISNDTSSRSTFASIIAGSSAYSGIFFGDKDSAEVGKIRYYHSDNSLQFYTNNTQNVTLDTNGNLQIANGNIVIGTSGKGIDFSATSDSSGTMTSELLSDYEEGTWTPAITGSTSGTVNSGIRVGTYTKIGRLVTARFTFINPSATTISGTWRLTGIPFSGRVSSSEYVGGYVHYNRNINKAGDWLSIFQEATSGITYFRVMGNYMNGTETYDISGNWPADVLFAGTIFYEAA